MFATMICRSKANRATSEVEIVANRYDEGGTRVIQCNIRDLRAQADRRSVACERRTLSRLVRIKPHGRLFL